LTRKSASTNSTKSVKNDHTKKGSSDNTSDTEEITRMEHRICKCIQHNAQFLPELIVVIMYLLIEYSPIREDHQRPIDLYCMPLTKRCGCQVFPIALFDSFSSFIQHKRDERSIYNPFFIFSSILLFFSAVRLDIRLSNIFTIQQSAERSYLGF
jgi:hypothetical protein